MSDQADPDEARIARLNDVLADRYTVERELGRGGTASVYLATDLRHAGPSLSRS